MSRHTPLTKDVTRTVGPLDEESDLVVTLTADGGLRLVAEPRRKLKRGEKLPTLEFDLQDLWASQDESCRKPTTSDDVAEKLQHALRLIRIAWLGEPNEAIAKGYRAHVRYRAKIRMRDIFKEVWDLPHDKIPTIDDHE